MIDLHCHILPGVDDGAGDLDEALTMCRRSFEDGVQAMVATPHLRHESFWNDDRTLLVDRFKALRSAVRREFEGEFEVYLGGEIALHNGSLDEIARLPDGALLAMAGTSYLLLELDWRGLGPDPLEMIHEVVVAGYRPIIAHPERVSWLMQDRDLVESMVDHGATMQLTAMSVTGELGSRVLEMSDWMLESGLVHFLSSRRSRSFDSSARIGASARCRGRALGRTVGPGVGGGPSACGTRRSPARRIGADRARRSFGSNLPASHGACSRVTVEAWGHG